MLIRELIEFVKRQFVATKDLRNVARSLTGWGFGSTKGYQVLLITIKGCFLIIKTLKR